ncbi:High-affinity nicotinic acid transporter [Fusarium torreyae]|uniref:High-affinity nicotinic acid transporter n=1 Tax=Fusarium torreyae TaxID=1237075 RepID=A0A9W8RQC1_9HYPO|nr:High-affinity nicotinic acid transporter [Fusarium torreyae]
MLSDKIKRRGIFIIGGFVVSAVGNVIVMVMREGTVRYVGFYVATTGIYTTENLVIGWAVNQVVGPNKRGAITGVVSSMGQVGGTVSPLAFPKSDGPHRTLLLCSHDDVLSYENKARAAGKRDHLIELPEEEQAKPGEKHPGYRYTL